MFLPLFAQVDQPFMAEEGSSEGVVSYERFGVVVIVLSLLL